MQASQDDMISTKYQKTEWQKGTDLHPVVQEQQNHTQAKQKSHIPLQTHIIKQRNLTVVLTAEEIRAHIQYANSFASIAFAPKARNFFAEIPRRSCKEA